MDGEWILVDGQKVRANGLDGTAGQDGTQVRINETTNEWELSLDGITWTSTGVKATGEGGESIFKSVVLAPDKSSVTFMLQGGTDFTIPITVEVVAVTGVTLDKATLTLGINASVTLIPTVAPANATLKKVNWTSSAPEIATVDANGRVTGVAVGSATITAITEDGGKTATCEVTVNNESIAVESIALNKNKLEIYEGDSETLVATITPDNATEQGITWATSDPKIAEVNENGQVIGINAGSATITATTADGNKTASCEVTVFLKEIPLTGISVNKSSYPQVGKKIFLRVTYTPNNATNKNVTFVSSDPEVASVDKDGYVTAHKVGKATITVTSEEGGFTSSCNVEVQPAM